MKRGGGEGKGREGGGKSRVVFKLTCPNDSESNCDRNGGCLRERTMLSA